MSKDEKEQKRNTEAKMTPPPEPQTPIFGTKSAPPPETELIINEAKMTPPPETESLTNQSKVTPLSEPKRASKPEPKKDEK